MTFHYTRSYRGPVQAVIFDWAGTVVDWGCLAPAVVFVEVFRRRDVPITLEEARGPMGAHKRTHIEEILAIDRVARRWQEVHGRAATEADVDALYADFIPLQLACLSDYSTLIPGTLEVQAELRRRNIKIGSTTGYSADMSAINVADAKRQGFMVDAVVSATEVPLGRPYPAMCLMNAIQLKVSTVAACVKVDDTVPGIDEGLNAGMWSIGVAASGNEVGLSLADYTKLPEAERLAKRERATRRLVQAGAHYVVDSIADLVPCLDDIEARLRRGETP